MPRTVETVVYTLKELSDTAKEGARAWYRETCLDCDWHECVFEDFETICQLLGVTLQTSPVPLMGGGTREKPHLYFRGFSSQGDGASFEGSFRHARGAARAVRAHAPKDPELHRIANALQEVQRPNFYQLTADIRHRGRYCHEYSMVIEDTWFRNDWSVCQCAAPSLRALASIPTLVIWAISGKSGSPLRRIGSPRRRANATNCRLVSPCVRSTTKR